MSASCPHSEKYLILGMYSRERNAATMSQLTSVNNLPCRSQVDKHIHIEIYTYTWYVVTTGQIQGCGRHGHMGLWGSLVWHQNYLPATLGLKLGKKAICKICRLQWLLM